MDIDLLGALAVREHGVSITPTAPKPRQVLALLALNADRVVPAATVIEELWGAAPPRKARSILQNYVLQLRELIGAALAQARDTVPRSAKDVLVTVPGGYLLRAGEGRSDVREFERLADAGRRALDAGDPTRAVRRLSEALALWTGRALADVRTGPHLHPQVARLEESRLCVLEQRIDVTLRLGRHRELLAELTALVSRYPTHESLCGQFMLALHRSGRRGEALSAYQRLRTTLVRDLGLEPSAALASVQRSILVSGPSRPAADDLSLTPHRPREAHAATGR
ncbi:BTAD domain-containing putative transcriptional regulator [Streptomyces sp. NPDC048566]|uniref:AfsR/SARP family transcriptional regulator n=1 Tax=Streptomyces sp. NPDC048566 TaxID=3365569 RepID=UPI0037163CBF